MPRLSNQRSFVLMLTLTLVLAATAQSPAAGPADPLLRLAPADAGVTLAVEDLRGHSRDYRESSLAGWVASLPMVRAWVASPRFSSFQAARRQIERGLGATLEEIRDNILGDAVVLTLRVPPDGRQDDARGMLLVRVRDRDLLDRLVDAINHDQTRKGELERIEERSRQGVPYRVRWFVPQTRRLPEFYLTLGDQTFAWSNSEELILGVIARSQNAEKGLGDLPAFQRVREGLPARVALSVFVNPRFLAAQLPAVPKPSTSGEARAAELVARYLDALEYLGGAVELRGAGSTRGVGLIVHAEEALDPDKTPGWLKRWAARPASPPRLERFPGAALVYASAHVDFQAIQELVRELTPASEQQRLDNLLLSLRGMLLGRDLDAAIFPNLGPVVWACVQARPPSRDGAGLSLVASIDLKSDSGEEGVASALDNGLRTVLAIYALDPRRGGGQLQVQTRDVRDARVTSLVPSSPFAYAIAPGRLVLGGSVDAVVGALEPEQASDPRFTALRAAEFPESQTFVRIDLERLRDFAERRRDVIARRIAARRGSTVESATKDLDHALSLLSGFQDAFLTSTLAPDARSVHQKLGFVAPAATSATTP